MFPLPIKKMFLQFVSKSIQQHAELEKTDVKNIQLAFGLKMEIYFINPENSEQYIKRSELSEIIEMKRLEEPDYHDERLAWMPSEPVMDNKYLLCHGWDIRELNSKMEPVKTTRELKNFLQVLGRKMDIHKTEENFAPLINQFLMISAVENDISHEQVKIVCGVKFQYRKDAIKKLEPSMIGMYLYNENGAVKSLDFDEMLEKVQEMVMQMQAQQAEEKKKESDVVE